ncbi:MAG: rhodanese-like domain-containing protein [Gammaproteobacteria bacterium]
MTAINRIRPEQAFAELSAQPRALLLDVRSRMEFEYVGHPRDASHIAWKEPPQWQVNQNFVAEVRALLAARGETAPESVPLYLICRSGARSLAAAEELARHGFIELYNIEEGFEGERDQHGHRSTIGGWRFRGLPWEQG